MAPAIRMLSALIEEPSASAPRRALRAFPPSGAGASAPVRSQRERRDGRASRRGPPSSRQTWWLALGEWGFSSNLSCPASQGPAPVHPAALAQNHARPPRWRLGDAPKRMPCAFLCFSPVNPSLALSMTRPEPLPWWARGTAPVRRGNERIRRFFPFGGYSERQEERSAPVVAESRRGHDRWKVVHMSLPAILPSVMPLGYRRGRMVYVSQLRYVMERPVVVDAKRA